jgi:hypothetical protein
VSASGGIVEASGRGATADFAKKGRFTDKASQNWQSILGFLQYL